MNYFKYLDWQNPEKTTAYILHEMPEHQQKLAQYIRTFGINDITFRVKDITSGFNEHKDNYIKPLLLNKLWH
jgi:hypothetical protein